MTSTKAPRVRWGGDLSPRVRGCSGVSGGDDPREPGDEIGDVLRLDPAERHPQRVDLRDLDDSDRLLDNQVAGLALGDGEAFRRQAARDKVLVAALELIDRVSTQGQFLASAIKG